MKEPKPTAHRTDVLLDNAADCLQRGMSVDAVALELRSIAMRLRVAAAVRESAAPEPGPTDAECEALLYDVGGSMYPGDIMAVSEWYASVSARIAGEK